MRVRNVLYMVLYEIVSQTARGGFGESSEFAGFKSVISSFIDASYECGNPKCEHRILIDSMFYI